MTLDTRALGAVTLPDVDGARHRLGDLWAQRPIVVAFARHFGWLLCREHAAQLRDSYSAITERGGDVVLIGTGNAAYGRDVVTSLGVPFLVLVDDDAEAARAATIRRVGPLGLFTPRSWGGTRRAWRAGHRIGLGGTRVTQLGATFVVGPGDRVRYEHRDAHTADHAPVPAVLASLASG